MIRFLDDMTGEVLLELNAQGEVVYLVDGMSLRDILAGCFAGWIVIDG